MLDDYSRPYNMNDYFLQTKALRSLVFRIPQVYSTLVVISAKAVEGYQTQDVNRRNRRTRLSPVAASS